MLLENVTQRHSASRWLSFGTLRGSLLCEYDMIRDFHTVNSVPGRGGASDGPARVIARGMVFVNRGYGAFRQMPANVLLAFGVGER